MPVEYFIEVRGCLGERVDDLLTDRLTTHLRCVTDAARSDDNRGRITNDIFEFMHFVEYDHFVGRQEFALMLQVEAVETEVDDDDVRTVCSLPRQFGEATLAEIALRLTRALI